MVVDGPPHIHAWHNTERAVPRRADGGGGGVLTCLWSACALPLRSGSVDAAVVDLPFGMAHKVAGGKNGLRTLYTQAFAEVARVMRPGGRLVALATSRRVMTEPMERLGTNGSGGIGLWENVQALNVNCGGGLAWILVWQRTRVPVPAGGVPVPAKTPKVKVGAKEIQNRGRPEMRGARPEQHGSKSQAQEERGRRDGGRAAQGAEDGRASDAKAAGKGWEVSPIAAQPLALGWPSLRAAAVAALGLAALLFGPLRAAGAAAMKRVLTLRR